MFRTHLIVTTDTFRGVKAFTNDGSDIGVGIGFMGEVGMVDVTVGADASEAGQIVEKLPKTKVASNGGVVREMPDTFSVNTIAFVATNKIFTKHTRRCGIVTT